MAAALLAIHHILRLGSTAAVHRTAQDGQKQTFTEQQASQTSVVQAMHDIDLCQAFLKRESVAGVNYQHNKYVRLIDGPH